MTTVLFQTSTLRPGLLVSLKTTLTGNVRYTKRDIEADHLTGDGARLARWETERLISDAAEHEQATKIRSKARAIVTSVCAASAFGLLCPESKRDQLEIAIREARMLAEDFNDRATLSRIGIYVIAGRIAQDDAEALRAINSEVADLIARMEEGLRNLDAKEVRDAANRARNLGMMLTPEAQKKVGDAIDIARATARKIVAAGEQAAMEIDTNAIAKLAESRGAFLDMDATEVQAPQAQTSALDETPAPSMPPPVGETEEERDAWNEENRKRKEELDRNYEEYLNPTETETEPEPQEIKTAAARQASFFDL